MRNRQQNNNLKEPRDKTLGFFTYGILKPGQIAYSKIRDEIEEKIECEINYSMLHRDGVPILTNKQGKTQGYTYYFKDNERAYNIICESFSNKLYRWRTIEIDDEEVNVLFGVKARQGSEPIEDYHDQVNFDGRRDPLFKEGLELIRENLEGEHYSWEKGFFKLQMNYMLLWSAIDRYCRLRYNKEKEHENRIEMSKEKVFRDALEKYANNEHRSVFNTEQLFENRFEMDNPKHCINYYYTLRCNIVHRGKSSMRDIDMLEQATRELLDIFEYMLDDVFREE
ncbi:MAG: hypothetical protein MJ232_06055 [archaeon]|nr:hypothetical protein [archaeon]